MIPSPVALQVQDLTQFEEMLIARAFPVIHVYTKPKGGKRAYKGYVITLPQNVYNSLQIFCQGALKTSQLLSLLLMEKTIHLKISLSGGKRFQMHYIG